jgi:type II secretory pathway pseudopilin PulG
MRKSRDRGGITLLEVLIAVATLAVLLALLLSAIVKAREAAAISQSKNNLRQIALATHDFAAANQGRLPRLGYGPTRLVQSSDGVQRAHLGTAGPALFVQILPYVGGEAMALRKKGQFTVFPLFLSPADPTAAAAIAKNAPVSSYAANAEVFLDDPRLPETFTDGTSNTIVFAEHYAFNCGSASFWYWASGNAETHRASFADTFDATPVTSGNPPQSTSSFAPRALVINFQVAPRPRDCMCSVPQTPHQSGMLVALGDGSVKQLSPSIAIPMFWGAVTPNRGEFVDLD